MTVVLVVRLSAMGDVVQSLGAVQALLSARPDFSVHWVVQRPSAPLLDGLGLASVVPHDRDGGVAAFRRTAGALRALRADVALDLQGNWKSAALARFSGARDVLGASGPGRRERLSGVLLGRRRRIEVRHPARVALALVRDLAPKAPETLPALVAGAEEIEREIRAVRSIGIDPERPFRAIVLGDPSDSRALRPAAVEREVGAAPVPVLCVGGPAEAGVRPPDGIAVLRHHAGEVRRLIALGAVIRSAGGDVFGPDTGATHVLSAAGAPTLAVFGPNDPAYTTPPGATVLRRSDPPACVPCRRRACRHPDGPVCMDVTTDSAYAVPASPA